VTRLHSPDFHNAAPAANHATKDAHVDRYARPPFVAGHDAPLIDERAATRERIATEVAVSTVVRKGAIRASLSLANRIELRERLRQGRSPRNLDAHRLQRVERHRATEQRATGSAR